MAQALRAAAERFHEDALRCVNVVVNPREPADVAEALTETGQRTDQRPHVWVPDSSLWIGMIRQRSAQASWYLTTRNRSLASSPIVITIPQAAAKKLKESEKALGWARLVKAGQQSSRGDAPTVRIVDPTRNAAGLLALLALQQSAQVAKASQTSQAGATVSAIRRLADSVAPTEEALLNSFEDSADSSAWRAIITSEQAVWQYNSGQPAHAAVAVYPQAGTLRLDYPYALVNGPEMSEEVHAAAVEFRKALLSPEGQRLLQAHGFRTAGGRAAQQVSRGRGSVPDHPKILQSPSPESALQVLQGWRRLTLGSRTLVLVDVSGSMAQTVPGSSRTRMEATIATAVHGLALFPTDTKMGLWSFSTRLSGSKDYKKLVPIGPLSEQRAKVREALKSLQPKAGRDTGLYDSILAAYQAVKKGYDPTMVNSVIVLTDGKNDDAHGISLNKLLRRIGLGQTPEMTIPVISIAFGPDIEPKALRKIGRETGGHAYVTRDSGKIKQIFFKAISRRTCRPDCG